MNEKRAKRLRQLVCHLMEKGAVAQNGWRVFAETSKATKVPVGNILEEARFVEVATGTQKLDPTCGLAIYRQMKKRA